MNITEKIWQVAAGDTDRNYVDLCLTWGVILNGPAANGPWIPTSSEESPRNDGLSSRKNTDLWRFCEEMKEGDFVVLRLGTHSVYGVGQVVGDYEHIEEFNDVDGWDIGHVRRVRWFWRYEDSPKEFDTYTLKLGDTTQILNSPVVESWLESLEIPEAERSRNLDDLRTCNDANVSVDDISEYLFNKGVSSNSISNLVDEIGEFIRIANWYYQAETPSENETINYLVVPLLRALGWTPQRMAIEWNRMDVALFSRLPREKDYLSAIVEAKKMGSSCLSALAQARSYALEERSCGRLIVTDGLRYGVFTRKDCESSEEAEFSLYAYLNLTRLRKKYPLYDCKGAQDALLAMAPEWQYQSTDNDPPG